MPLDHACYYDFASERRLSDWRELPSGEGGSVLEITFDSEEGEFLFLHDLAEPCDAFVMTGLCVNGREYHPGLNFKAAYMGVGYCRAGVEIRLNSGSNTLVVEGCGFRENLGFYLAEAPVPVAFPPKFHALLEVPKVEFHMKERRFDTTGFFPGAGCSPTVGRFGFAKGDGLLDCAMPTLGNIDKMYLCGDPKYHKVFRWNYSTLPEGAARHGSYSPANHGLENDRITINYMSVRWETEFNGFSYSCTGSLGSPGVITECKNGIMRLSDLEFAGNYRYILIPRPGGKLEVSSLRDVTDLTMGENFLLFFGCTEFPDLPLLLVFQKQPERMEAIFHPRTHRLNEIRFPHTPLMISATPFGIESFDPIPPDDDLFLKRAAERCRFWSRALLAFPVRCEEYFCNNQEKKETEIIQNFSYRIINDEWNTPPLKLAPLPPMTSLCGIAASDDNDDFLFPSKYGWLRGAYGESSSFRLPWMPSARKFPLRDTSDSRPEVLLQSGWDSYFEFVSRFPVSMQSYPYAGALLEPYALVGSMQNFLDPDSMGKLRKVVAERVGFACDGDRSYDYPVIVHSQLMSSAPDDEGVLAVYSNPEMAHRKLWNWYQRTEPFTGIQYHICYLNVGFFSSGRIKIGTKEEVAALKIPLIENDWGVGLTFYYLYLSALLTGDWEPIRKNWTLLRSAYSFFEKMHDWACMGTGYCDKAVLWVEGANYGAFTAFTNMARALDDKEAYEQARYLAAKQFALRLGVVRASQHYLCKFYKVDPWYISKLFHEESNPCWQHQGVPPGLTVDRFRTDGIYNLTTEGLYPELFEAMLHFLPKETECVLEKLRHYLSTSPGGVEYDWITVQQTASLLIFMALDPKVDSRELYAAIEFARNSGTLMTKWRGIHIFSRRLPEHYLEAQLLAWDAMKRHPLWLEHWQDLVIDSAVWNKTEAVISFRAGKSPLMILGIRRRPQKIMLNDREICGVFTSDTLELRLPHSGELHLIFH